MPFLLPWKKSPPHSQLGIGWHNNSIRLVKLSHPHKATPTLDFYKSLPNHKRSIVLRQFVKHHSLKRVPCVGVMGIGHYQLFLTEAPQVPDSEVLAAARWQVQTLIDFSVEEAIVDVFYVPPSVRHPQKMIYAAVARQKVVQAHSEQLLGAGFKLTALDIPELALRNVAAKLPEDKDGVALLWLTPKHEMLTITRCGTLYLSRAVSRNTNCSLPLIIAETRRSLAYYETHFNQAPINHLVIAPMLPPLPKLCHDLATHLGINVRFLDLNELIHSRQPLTVAQQAQCFPMLGAALRKE